jgi:protein-disulfide isomerase
MPDDVENDPPEPDRREVESRLPGRGQREIEDGQGIEGGREAARGLRRRRRRQLALTALAVAAALGGILLATSGSGGSSSRPGGRANTAQTISSLLAGIPQSANVLGRPAAPVTLRWFGDLECPYCREFTLGALSSIIQRWVRSGRLKIEYLSMETATREPKTFETQQVAALAAGLQDKMWNFIETFYYEQGEEDSGYVTEQYLHRIASQIPRLNVALWTEDRSDPELAIQVEADKRAAARLRFRGTPSFQIGRAQGAMYPFTPRSLTNPQSFDDAVEELSRA